MLTQLYLTYHHQCWCYRKLFRSFKHNDLALQMTAAGMGLWVQWWVSVWIPWVHLLIADWVWLYTCWTWRWIIPRKWRSLDSLHQLSERVERIERTSSRKEFQKDILLFELNRLDGLIIDMCLPISDTLNRKYYKIQDQPSRTLLGYETSYPTVISRCSWGRAENLNITHTVVYQSMLSPRFPYMKMCIRFFVTRRMCDGGLSSIVADGYFRWY